MTEIERKFLVKKMPDLSNIPPKHYERYYLVNNVEEEIRIQKVDGKFEKERKEKVSDLERTSEKEIISEEEFEQLKKRASSGIVRDSYLIDTNPEVSIKVYHGRFEGLIRAEVEFGSNEEAEKFQPLDWMGKEITDSPLGKDSRLLGLGNSEFQQLLFDDKN